LNISQKKVPVSVYMEELSRSYSVRNLSYASRYRNIDFRRHPEKYPVGKDDAHTVMIEPYRSELMPHWKYRTPRQARASAAKIYTLFLSYRQQNDFVGMDMARKFLQMGFTRARSYIDNLSGDDSEAAVSTAEDEVKSATIFFRYYRRVLRDPRYIAARRRHLLLYGTS
jgi:hypothetical protein